MLGLFKFVGAGLAAMSLIGAGIGIGVIFAAYIMASSKSKDAQAALLPVALLGFALCEATGLFGLMICFIILFS